MKKLRDQTQQIQVHAAEARTDALTLLANRRAFDEELARRIAEFRRHRSTFSLIMADVDRFKKVNDTYGHQIGDEVLRGVARLLRRKVREIDFVARYGGKEFAIILPATNLDDASKAAMRMCEAIEKRQFDCDEKGIRVTLSSGVAELLDYEDGNMLVARADKALYAAKDGGRNCAYRHDGETVGRVVGNNELTVPECEVELQSETASNEPQENEKTIPSSDARATKPRPDRQRTVQLDEVSGVCCRSAFCQQVRNRTAEWKRGGPTFSVALIDVNQYAQGGEDCSQEVRAAATLVATRFLPAAVREMESVGQYGPGCFALLLPTAELANAVKVAERLRKRFSECSPPSQLERQMLTLNVGVAQIMEQDDSISLLKRAEVSSGCRKSPR